MSCCPISSARKNGVPQHLNPRMSRANKWPRRTPCFHQMHGVSYRRRNGRRKVASRKNYRRTTRHTLEQHPRQQGNARLRLWTRQAPGPLPRESTDIMAKRGNQVVSLPQHASGGQSPPRSSRWAKPRAAYLTTEIIVKKILFKGSWGC